MTKVYSNTEIIKLLKSLTFDQACWCVAQNKDLPGLSGCKWTDPVGEECKTSISMVNRNDAAFWDSKVAEILFRLSKNNELDLADVFIKEYVCDRISAGSLQKEFKAYVKNETNSGYDEYKLPKLDIRILTKLCTSVFGFCNISWQCYRGESYPSPYGGTEYDAIPYPCSLGAYVVETYSETKAMAFLKATCGLSWSCISFTTLDFIINWFWPDLVVDAELVEFDWLSSANTRRLRKRITLRQKKRDEAEEAERLETRKREREQLAKQLLELDEIELDDPKKLKEQIIKAKKRRKTEEHN